MRRACLALFLAGFVASCSSPSSPTALHGPRLPLTVDGLTLVSASPAPGSEIALDSCGPEGCLT